MKVCACVLQGRDSGEKNWHLGARKKQIKIYVFDFLKNPLYVKYVVEIKQKGKKHRAVVRS